MKLRNFFKLAPKVVEYEELLFFSEKKTSTNTYYQEVNYNIGKAKVVISGSYDYFVLIRQMAIR